jgi:hypothetical protein
MKKSTYRLLGAILLAQIISSSAYAQKAFEKANVFLNGGAVVLPKDAIVAFSAEYGMNDRIGIGFRSSGSLNSRSSSNRINASIYANYHLLRSAKLDSFAGFGLGRAFGTNSIPGREDGNFSGLNLNLQAGVRYLVTNRLGAYSQLFLPFRRATGAGVEVGATFKINRLKQ